MRLWKYTNLLNPNYLDLRNANTKDFVNCDFIYHLSFKIVFLFLYEYVMEKSLNILKYSIYYIYIYS